MSAGAAAGPRGTGWIGAVPAVSFLRRELAPTPGRFGATLRLTLACTAATVPIMVHHIPHGLVVMIVMYLISKEDTTATLLGSVLALLGVTVGFALALPAWQVALKTPWRLAFVFLFAAAGLYIGRSTVLGAMGSAIGLPAALAMVLPDIVPGANPEAMTEFVLWLWWCVALGLAVNLGVQLLLSPGDPLVLLRRALVERLRAVDASVRSLAGLASRAPRPSLAPLTIAGATEMLALLKTATLRHAWARRHRPELGALISLVDQLVTAAAALEAVRPSADDRDTRGRLERVANACARAARELGGAASRADPEPIWAESPPAPPATAPALAAMEHVLSEIALAMPGRGRPPGPTPSGRASLLVPDAFTNPEYVQSAVRGGLACLICEVLLVGFAYPGIYTSVITCFVVSLSTVGASAQKGTLRFAGAAVGGGMGILALMYVLPHVDTLGGFWVVFAIGTAAAAWVNFGSPRVSYGGYQVGLAFYKVVLQGWGPVTELTVARDRLVGIAIGLVVFGLLEHLLWPVRADDLRRRRFAEVLRSLGALARMGDRDRTGAGPDRDLDEVRRRIAHDLAETQRAIEESKFEPRRGDLDAFERSVGDAQIIFLVLLSLAYQRRAPGTPRADLPIAARQLEDAVSGRLTSLADPAGRRPEPPRADLESALAGVEVTLVDRPLEAAPNEAVTAARQRLRLYRTLVPLVSQLDPWLVAHSRARTASER